MEMKKTEIAILDSGIDENILALYGLYDVIQHSEGHTDDKSASWNSCCEGAVKSTPLLHRLSSSVR